MFFVACINSHFRWTDYNRLMMSLESPVSCVSDAFSLYRISFFWIYCNFYHSANHILLVMSLTMMGLTPGPLVPAFFLFTLNNLLVVLTTLLVVLVAWGMDFLL